MSGPRGATNTAEGLTHSSDLTREGLAMQATQSAVETWLPVVGHEGAYEVSDLGRVRSLPRKSSYGRPVRGQVLKPKASDRYPTVGLGRMAGKIQSARIHILVTRAFLGPPPEGMEVCHNNGDPYDNRLANLRYDTHAANQRDTIRLGRNPYVNRTHCKNDHEFTAENTRWITPTRRQCITCRREYFREYDRRRLPRKRAVTSN